MCNKGHWIKIYVCELHIWGVSPRWTGWILGEQSNIVGAARSEQYSYMGVEQYSISVCGLVIWLPKSIRQLLYVATACIEQYIYVLSGMTVCRFTWLIRIGAVWGGNLNRIKCKLSNFIITFRNSTTFYTFIQLYLTAMGTPKHLITTDTPIEAVYNIHKKMCLPHWPHIKKKKQTIFIKHFYTFFIYILCIVAPARSIYSRLKIYCAWLQLSRAASHDANMRLCGGGAGNESGDWSLKLVCAKQTMGTRTRTARQRV